MTLRGGGWGSGLSVIMTLTVGKTICESPLMCFNASKCKYMLISRSPNKTLPTSEVELNGEAIQRVTVFGCLGFRRSKLVPPHSENYKTC